MLTSQGPAAHALRTPHSERLHAAAQLWAPGWKQKEKEAQAFVLALIFPLLKDFEGKNALSATEGQEDRNWVPLGPSVYLAPPWNPGVPENSLRTSASMAMV